MLTVGWGRVAQRGRGRRGDSEIDGLTDGRKHAGRSVGGGPFWLPQSSYLVYGDGGGEAPYFLSC